MPFQKFDDYTEEDLAPFIKLIQGYLDEEKTCPKCGKTNLHFMDMYCPISKRGANSNCKDHIEKLICSTCAEEVMKNGGIH